MYYAQRGEDRKLCEMLGHCNPGKPSGAYVDIGAWSPTSDSVTKHFYDTGWSGINVEPVPEYFEQLQGQRQRDVNLMVAIDDQLDPFPRKFTHVRDTGLSTFREDYVAQGMYNGRQMETLTVSTMRLVDLLRLFLLPSQHIDFLKVDVEGWEYQVLSSNDWRRFRPRILCIEATIPGTDIEAPEVPRWHSLLDGHRFKFEEFDGLNRWYTDSLS